MRASLDNGKDKIPASGLTCFNTGGIDPYGKPFVKRVDVGKGAVQAFWIGVDNIELSGTGSIESDG